MADATLNSYFRKSYQDFSGGLNTLQNPLILKQNQFSELVDAIINEDGTLERAKGYVVEGSPFPDDADSFIRMVVNYKRGTTVDNLVVAAQDDGNANATYKVDIKQTTGNGSYDYIGYTTGTATFTNGSPTVEGQSSPAWNTQLKAGDKIKPNATSTWYEIQSITDADTLVLTSNFAEATQTTAAYTARIILHKDYIPQAIVFNNNLIVTNGDETPFYWNNTTTAKITDADCPKGKFIEAYKNRVFIGATGAAPSTIFWSASSDETSWDSTGKLGVFPQDNGNICAIRNFADSLMVFKDNGNIYQVSGNFDQTAVGQPSYVRKIDVPDNMGTIAGFTVSVHDDGRCYFLTQTGVYAMDQRFQFEKMSWPIDTDIRNIVLRGGNVSSKAHTYDTKTQWDTGTHSGTRATAAGTLTQYADALSIDGVYTSAGEQNWAAVIDSSNNIHVAYVSSADNSIIKYLKWEPDGTQTTETVVDESAAVSRISIATAADGDIGVAYLNSASTNTVKFVERTGGAWGAAATANANTGWDCHALVYNSSSEPRIASLKASTIEYVKRTAGTWGSPVTVRNTVSGALDVAMVLKSTDDPRIVYATGTGLTVECSQSNDQGATFSTLGTSVGATFTPSSSDMLCAALNSTGQTVAYFSNGSGAQTVRKNFDSGASSTSANAALLRGFAIHSDSDYLYQAHSQKCRLYYEGTSTYIETTAQTLSAGSDSRPGHTSMSNNGVVMATAALSNNANQVLVRRVAVRASWTAPVTSDSTLTAWGVYDVTDQTDNGATVSHTIGVSTTSTIPSPSAIVDGQVISSDATKHFNQVVINSLLSGFTAPTIGSVVLNYTGTGIGPTLPAAVVFDNEWYLSAANSGDSANTQVYFLDTERAWIERIYPVIFMARYRGSLYGGSASNGDVYILNSGYQKDGANYTTTAVTKEDLLGSLELQKSIYKVYAIFDIQDSGTFTFSYRTDSFRTPGGSDWVDTTVDQTQAGVVEIPYISGLCNSIQFKVTCASPGVNMNIVGFVVVYSYVNIR